MSFYVSDGSGYAQTGAATTFTTYGTFQQTPNQQVIDTSAGYGYSGGNIQGDATATWQMQQAAAAGHNGALQPHYQQMSTVAAGHHAATAAGHHVTTAANYGPIGGPVPGVIRQGAMTAVHGAGHLAGHRGGHRGQHHHGGHHVVAIQRGGGGHRGHRGGQRGMYGQSNNTVQGPKPIKATEIKSYLYAWCTQKKLKPEYTYEPQGRSPKVRYLCSLAISGIDFKASEEARSKREAQTAAAWAFCDEMVRKGYMKAHELPPKQAPEDSAPKPVPAVAAQPAADDKKGDGKVQNPEYGGWTIDNSRQRLNRFCMSERISCDFENIVEGTVTKTTISKLMLDIKRLQQPLIVETRASNKKQANANCAVLAVRALFKHGLIEKSGEKIIHKGYHQKMEEDEGENDDGTQKHGLKRKAEEPLQFDENGNWTLETARAKLQDFYAVNGKDLTFDEKEIGTLQDRQYQVS